MTWLFEFPWHLESLDLEAGETVQLDILQGPLFGMLFLHAFQFVLLDG